MNYDYDLKYVSKEYCLFTEKYYYNLEGTFKGEIFSCVIHKKNGKIKIGRIILKKDSLNDTVLENIDWYDFTEYIIRKELEKNIESYISNIKELKLRLLF